MPFGIQVHSLIFWYEYVQEWYDMHAYVTSYGPQVDYKCTQITLRDFMSAYVMSRHVLCETQKCHVGGGVPNNLPWKKLPISRQQSIFKLEDYSLVVSF